MKRTRIKICGLTRPQDVCSAVVAGSDALGFVFAPLSARRLEKEAARTLVRDVPAFIDRVGLFQDQEAEEVAGVLDQVPLNLLQFHGSESAEYCRQFGMPYIKAISMTDDDALASAESEFEDAAGLVLDSHQIGKPGGTGVPFDWSGIRESELPLVIAGGLNPSNVSQLVQIYKPWAVDVSSGVESRPGVKDKTLVEKFIAEVERGNGH
ncbi:MAG TPA: phosphoribosylanthranilate isomerase [Xanthomonadales bacterium]|nr:phosphoribosylanthranilate isomerase [Xanthomonadales bacterium]